MALKSKYTLEQIKEMDLISFFVTIIHIPQHSILQI